MKGNNDNEVVSGKNDPKVSPALDIKDVCIGFEPFGRFL
jgi:hypothetical protein